MFGPNDTYRGWLIIAAILGTSALAWLVLVALVLVAA